ncbi:MAG TPA: hypothetical protein VEO54_17430 [Thermoanaerobaculia bacterium]|nr:hypothetical protein [Thermoanaerobaculia bacterium]
MHIFNVKTRRWPTGEIIASTVTTTFGPPPAGHDETAPQYLALGPNPTDLLQFLFWHTGRRVTNIRHVHWSFTAMSWSVWDATKWYGFPGGGPGNPRIHAEAFSLISNSVMSVDTPISGVTGGATWPFMGNNNDVGTASGPALVSAVEPLSGLSLCGWQKLIYGGAPGSDTFTETDADVTATTVPGDGSGNVFIFTPEAKLSAAQNESGEALAAYGSTGSSGGGLIGILKDLVFERIPRRPIDIVSDPSPLDRIRQQLVLELIRRTQPGEQVMAGTDFNRIIEAVPNMSAEELKRTLQSVQTQVGLGQTAVSSIEAQIKRLGKTK